MKCKLVVSVTLLEGFQPKQNIRLHAVGESENIRQEVLRA